MITTISKADIDRLGNKVRAEKGKISDETLLELQNYRTSHKDVLSSIFKVLCKVTEKVHPSAIVTYRIKRFESIIGKLDRFPEMRFSRMWDIGGCRCILRNDDEVYKLKEYIREEEALELVKEHDYILSPQKDGYKSLHLFLRHTGSNKVIEVQLRSQLDHNWATLVEITDLLFDSRLKEYGENKSLLRFHFLLAKIYSLDMNEKQEIADTLKEYDYFERLSEVFSRNYIKVRKQWFEIESRNNHKFFLIETTKEDIPKILSFSSSTEAEEHYFNVYKSSQSANVVLTHLQRPSYKQISIAYSNYILTFHSFLTDCYMILESLIVESIKNGKYLEFYNIYNLYSNLIYNHISNLIAEIKEIQNYSKTSKNKRLANRKKEKEWKNDIQKQIDQSILRSNKLQHAFDKNMPQSRLSRYIIKNTTKFVNNKYRRKLERVLATTKITS